MAKKPANAGLLSSVHSLWVTNLNPRPKNFPKISGSNLKYSQILENDCGDWFDFDCVAGMSVRSPKKTWNFRQIPTFFAARRLYEQRASSARQGIRDFRKSALPSEADIVWTLIVGRS